MSSRPVRPCNALRGRSAHRPGAADGCGPDVARAFSLIAVVWVELALVQGLVPGDRGTTASFAGALALLAASRRSGVTGRPPLGAAPPRTRAHERWGPAGAWIEWPGWVCAGVLLQPWLAGAAQLVWLRLGGEAVSPATGAAPDPWRIASLLVLAPVFEESLYRGRLFDALARSRSVAVAVGVSSFFFALPHLGALHGGASLLAGVALGAVRAWTRRLGPCIAVHLGFNLVASGWVPSPFLPH